MFIMSWFYTQSDITQVTHQSARISTHSANHFLNAFISGALSLVSAVVGAMFVWVAVAAGLTIGEVILLCSSMPVSCSNSMRLISGLSKEYEVPLMLMLFELEVQGNFERSIWVARLLMEVLPVGVPVGVRVGVPVGESMNMSFIPWQDLLLPIKWSSLSVSHAPHLDLESSLSCSKEAMGRLHLWPILFGI